MQDNLINSQEVDKIINTLFGTYEKFVLSLIERRKELEEEKNKLQQRLEKIRKEETLVKNTLTGFHGSKIGSQYYNAKTNALVDKKPLTFSLRKSPQNSPAFKNARAQEAELSLEKSNVANRISYISEEQALIENVLKAFHGKVFDGKYYDGFSHDLTSHKPEKVPGLGLKAAPLASIGELLSFKQSEYNTMAGKTLISDERLYSPSQKNDWISLQPTPLKSYQNEALSLLQKEYLPHLSIEEIQKEVSFKDFDDKTITAFKEGTAIGSFVKAIAEEYKLEKAENSKGMKY